MSDLQPDRGARGPGREERPSAALVLETNNLRGGDAGAVIHGMQRLLARLAAQTRALATLAEVVVTHDGLGPGARDRLERAAGTPVRFVEIRQGTGYYEAKNLGFEATTAEVVAFGDADCWPDEAWLERLLAPFDDPEVEVVAGRTTYRDGILGQAVTAIDFLYFDPPDAPAATRNFYANNVAFRRRVFAGRRYEKVPGMYRGPCQVLALRLRREGVRVRFAPDAHTVHRFPDGFRDLVRLRLYRGADTPKLVPYLAAAYVPEPLRPLAAVEPLVSLAALAVRFGFSARALALGATHPRAPLPPLGLAWRTASLALMAAVSGLDAVGALARATGLASFGLDERGDAESLSYLEDRDGLERGTAPGAPSGAAGAFAAAAGA